MMSRDPYEKVYDALAGGHVGDAAGGEIAARDSQQKHPPPHEEKEIQAESRKDGTEKEPQMMCDLERERWEHGGTRHRCRREGAGRSY